MYIFKVYNWMNVHTLIKIALKTTLFCYIYLYIGMYTKTILS